MVLIIDEDRKEVIKLFMSEAAQKQQGLKNGLSSHPYPQTYKEAIGLVEVCVAFEAFINALDIEEASIWKKRELFSSTYQDLFTSIFEGCKTEINKLAEQLNVLPLIDMTPEPKKRDPIRIGDVNKLSESIEVIYRVRSNLVHGNKSLSSDRNKLLIENSFRLLYKIMDAVLRKEGIIR